MAGETDAKRQEWTTVVGPVSGWLDLHLRELWRYRDLVLLFVRRDFVSHYSQTILGPLWFLLQPIMTTLMFTLVFGRVARLPTDGAPASLFYLCGVVVWGYFSSCVSSTSATFVANAHLFGKVWFPRLAIPVSVVISGLVGFGIQLGLLALMVGWAAARGEIAVPGWGLALLPLLVLQMGLLALGFGVVVSSMTTRYRDLTHLVGFGVQLWMFATPVVYPASRIPERWSWLMYANPMAPVVEAFRLAVLGVGSFDARQMAASAAITLGTLAAGVVMFSRIEKSFMDTV